MTPVIFHGPSSRDRAVELAAKLGRPVSDPLGDSGLKVDDARALVELAGSSGIGDLPPSIVVGPLDAATPEASDALLKTLEDLCDGPLKIVLWADHLQGVSGTIQSRTHAVWCPETPLTSDLLFYMKVPAQALAKALLEDDPVKILGVLEDLSETKEGAKDWPDLLLATCRILSQSIQEPENAARVTVVWDRIRRVLDGKGSILTAADALLPDLGSP